MMFKALYPVLLLAMGGADPYTLGNPHSVRPTHLALDLTLDFKKKVVHGVCDLTLRYETDSPVAQLDLDTQGLTIEKVLDADTSEGLRFVLEPQVPFLGRRLRITLPSRRPRTVRVVYETGPDATALQWLEPRQTTSGKLPFLLTQSEPTHARSWIPCIDSPDARVSYEAVVHVPPGMSGVMSAEHLHHEPDKGIFRFRMPQTIPTYLIALAAGEIAFKPLGERTGVYAEPGVVEKAAWELADMERMLRAAEALYGPYAWGRWDAIVLPPSFPFGGMENPRITFATPTVIAGDRSLVSVMAHELAHSWSGNLVTNATWGDIWLNEGITTYIENRILESVYGKEFAEMDLLLSERQLRRVVDDPATPRDDTRLFADVDEPDPEKGPPSAIAYDKGAAFLHVLEERFGRARFDPFLRRYFERNAFTSMTTARFLELLKSDVFQGDERAWQAVHVEEWVYGRGLPGNMVVPASKRFERTREAAKVFAASGALEGVRADWVTAEWLDFLGSLPRTLGRERMAELDRRFHLSSAHNSEVLFAWLQLAVRNTYQPAFPALESFLTRQGRLKFVAPLYAAMEANPATRDLAGRIYAKARPGYHPITVAALDPIVQGGAVSRPPGTPSRSPK